MPTNINGNTGIDKVQDGTVVSADIATLDASKLTGSIAAARIANNTIDSAHITAGAVDDAHLATGITASKLTGALPAISAANLTAIPAAQVTGTMSGVNFKDVGLTTNAIGSIGGGTQDIDLTLGNSITGTVDTSTTTFTFSNPTASDELCVFSLVLTNGGSQTVNFPASVDWAGGTAPTLTTAGVDILIFATVDGGTIWHGQSYSLDSKTPS